MPQTISVSKDALFQEVSGEMVILDLATESYFGLNDVGARVWSLLESGKNLEEIKLIVIDEFEVEPKQLAEDLENLLEELSAEGLVLINDE